ncbi:hypothetical protein LJB99_05825 [Deltaproteobacteria bacterium OttesenSCG-928-K17]|nr:hypothetical protein [Deltaproteobacteria bacterium OttesenSCG-928-K17]
MVIKALRPKMGLVAPSPYPFTKTTTGFSEPWGLEKPVFYAASPAGEIFYR